jgi:hypothetical protein
MSDAGVPYTIIRPTDMTGDQLALSNSQRVTATTKHGKVVGGRVKNGCQVFLSESYATVQMYPSGPYGSPVDVPYGRDVPRWTDPQTLPVSYQYENKEFTKDGLYCAQPTRENELQCMAAVHFHEVNETYHQSLPVIVSGWVSQPRIHSLPTYTFRPVRT